MRKPDYERGGIVLYCGDCLEILPELSGIDAVVTDGMKTTTAYDTIAAKENCREQATSREREAQGRSVEAVDGTQGRDRVAVQHSAVPSSKDSGVFFRDAGGDSKGNEATRNKTANQGEYREAERKIQGWISESGLSNCDNQGQVQQMPGDGRPGDSSQERRPFRQSLGESGSSLQFLSHERDEAQVVGGEKGGATNTEKQRAGWLGKVAICTDPPYGIKRDGKPFSTSSHGGHKGYKFGGWDESPPSQKLFDLILEMSKYAIIWGGNYFANNLPPTSKWLVWDKGQRIDQADAELAWTNIPGALRVFILNRVAIASDGAVHPTQKPVALMTWCLSHIPCHCNTIIDPYMGSGTTGVACIKTGRNFIGIEKDPAYFQIAVKRIDAALDADRDSLWTAKELAKETQPALFSTSDEAFLEGGAL